MSKMLQDYSPTGLPQKRPSMWDIQMPFLPTVRRIRGTPLLSQQSESKESERKIDIF